MRTKHSNDQNHGKNGCIGGNPRYGKARGNWRGQRQVEKNSLFRQSNAEFWHRATHCCKCDREVPTNLERDSVCAECTYWELEDEFFLGEDYN